MTCRKERTPYEIPGQFQNKKNTDSYQITKADSSLDTVVADIRFDDTKEATTDDDGKQSDRVSKKMIPSSACII